MRPGRSSRPSGGPRPSFGSRSNDHRRFASRAALGFPSGDARGDEVGDPQGLREIPSDGGQGEGFLDRTTVGADEGDPQCACLGPDRHHVVASHPCESILPVVVESASERPLDRREVGLVSRDGYDRPPDRRMELVYVDDIEAADRNPVEEHHREALAVSGVGHHLGDPVGRVMAVHLHERREDALDVRRSLDDDADHGHGLVRETERRIVNPEEPGLRLHAHISLSPPVTWSTIWFGPGPIPRHVTVPGGSSVRPASSTRAVVSPIDRALVRRAWRSESVPPFTTTFFCPSAHQSENHFRWWAFASKAAITEAWATWTASLPRDSSRSERTAITSL